MNGKIVLAILVLFGCLAPVSAQDAPAVISADTIARLNSVAHIDFASLPSEAGLVQSGWFILSPTSDLVTVKNRADELVTLDFSGNIVDHYGLPGSDGLPTTIEDAGFSPSGNQLASAHLEGGNYYVAYRSLDTGRTTSYRFETQDVPLRIWWDDGVWLEVSPVDASKSRYIEQLKPAANVSPGAKQILSDSEIQVLPSGPENDPDSYLRIGRINAPFAVTITQDGMVKRWNLETGKVTTRAPVKALPGAGALNADGTFFAWRDGESEALHLLNFETGENHVVASLNGTYLPFLLLTPAADAIIAVNPGLQPVVTAWDTATGRRYDLGEYRTCKRQPDMVRLRGDGTTLVIGCDTGLDIWRVKRPT
jgi:hypothetical protein